MKYKFVVIALTVTLLLLAGRPALAQNTTPVDQNGAAIPQIIVYPEGQRPASLDYLLKLPYKTDLVLHGTMWEAENKSYFAAFSPKGWGTVTRAKSAGSSLWVHISPPILPFLWNSQGFIYYVEFCAKCSNGASSKPITLDLFENGTRFYTAAISWPAVNTLQCAGVPYASGVWKQDLGISVQIYYANTTDTVTLYKAWVSMGY